MRVSNLDMRVTLSIARVSCDTESPSYALAYPASGASHDIGEAGRTVTPAYRAGLISGG
jgi:hypothetical protein